MNIHFDKVTDAGLTNISAAANVLNSGIVDAITAIFIAGKNIIMLILILYLEMGYCRCIKIRGQFDL